MEFICNNCGKCCKSFGEKHYLPIFEWEKDILEREAKARNISLNFQPTDLILDKRTGLTICAQFGMTNEPCPFLSKENLCSIYPHRPLICSSFPLKDSPLYNKEHHLDMSSFVHCDNLDIKQLLIEHFGLNEKPTKISKSEITKKYLSAFGYEPLISVTQRAMIEDILGNMLKELIERKTVKFRRIGHFDYNKYTPTPFFDFLVKIRSVSPEMKEETIKKLTNREWVKGMIDEIIKS